MLVLTVFKNELRAILKDWVALTALLLFPLLFIWLFVQVMSGYHYNSQYSQPLSLGLVNLDNTPVSRVLVSQLESTDYIKDILEIQHLTQEQGLEKLKAGELAGVVILPVGFTESIYLGVNKTFTFIGNSRQRAKADLLRNEMESVGALISAGQSGVITVCQLAQKGGANHTLLSRLYNDTVYSFTMSSLGRGRVFTEETVSSIPNLTPEEYFTAALLAVFASFLGLRGMNSLVEEREKGILDRLKATAAGTWVLILGKVLAALVIAVFQLMFIIIATHLLFENYLGASIGYLLSITIATAFVVSCWAVFIACVTTSGEAADLLGYIGTFILIIIGGNIYPLAALPPWVQKLSCFSFTKWAMDGYMQMFSGTHNPSYVPVLTLFVFGLVFLIIAGFALAREGRSL